MSVPVVRTSRLPREIEADPAHEAIRARLASGSRQLWSGGRAVVPVVPLRPALAAALAAAHQGGHLVLGFEGAEKALAAEAHGLALVARRGGPAPGARVSRLLLLSNDGADRLYRHVERLVIAHAPRVQMVMLDADAGTVGRSTTARDPAVKVVLVRHKQAVAAFLRALTA